MSENEETQIREINSPSESDEERDSDVERSRYSDVERRRYSLPTEDDGTQFGQESLNISPGDEKAVFTNARCHRQNYDDYSAALWKDDETNDEGMSQRSETESRLALDAASSAPRRPTMVEGIVDQTDRRRRRSSSAPSRRKSSGSVVPFDDNETRRTRHSTASAASVLSEHDSLKSTDLVRYLPEGGNRKRSVLIIAIVVVVSLALLAVSVGFVLNEYIGSDEPMNSAMKSTRMTVVVVASSTRNTASSFPSSRTNVSTLTMVPSFSSPSSNFLSTASNTQTPPTWSSTSSLMPPPTTTNSAPEIPFDTQSLSLNTLLPDYWTPNCGISNLMDDIGYDSWEMCVQFREKIENNTDDVVFYWRSHCGAILIRNETVLTSAHCFQDFLDGTFNMTHYRVAEGPCRINSTGKEILRVKVHPSYEPNRGSEQDLAILHTGPHPGVVPLCLPNPNWKPALNLNPDFRVWAFGGGERESWHIIKAKKLRVILDTSCAINDSDALCLRVTQTGSCNPNGGSGLSSHFGFNFGGIAATSFAFENTQVAAGFNSWGRPCQDRLSSNYFIRLTNYVTWIHNEIYNYS